MLPLGASKPNVVLHRWLSVTHSWYESVLSDIVPEDRMVEALTLLRPPHNVWSRITTLDGRVRYFLGNTEMNIEDIPKELLE